MDLLQAVRETLAGRRFLSYPLSDQIINAYLKKSSATPFDPYDWLTPREKVVLHLVAERRTSAEIAERLSLSQRTVETHRANLMRKLGLHTQAEVVAYAISLGIVLSDH